MDVVYSSESFVSTGLTTQNINFDRADSFCRIKTCSFFYIQFPSRLTLLAQHSCDSKKNQLLTVETLVERNAHEATVAPMVGSGRVRSQAFSFVLVRLAVKCFSYCENVLRFYIVKKFYKSCILNAICKDNTAKNCIIFQQKRFIPINFHGSH
jgi:hypothetical protein